MRALPSNSINFRSCVGHSVIILCVHGTFHPIPSTFVKTCVCGTFLKTFCAATGPSVYCQPSVFPRDYPLTFCVSAGHSINLCQLSVHLRDLLSTFRASAGPSFNFLQDILSTFRASTEHSINFPRICRRFRQPPSNSCASAGQSVNFLCIHGTFYQLLCIRGNFVNFRQVFVCPWDLL